MADETTLRRVLGEIQRRGGIGPVAVPTAIAHARQFVDACPPDARSLIDLGSGGGLPGLVIAVDRVDLSVRLVERRAKRADLLRFGVRSLGLIDRVVVDDRDVEDVMADAARTPVDVVTARSFAPPLVTMRMARALLRIGGVALISDPPTGAARWTDAELSLLQLGDDGRIGGIRRFTALP